MKAPIIQLREMHEALMLPCPPPKWGKPGRPAKPASAPAMKLPRPACHKRPKKAAR